MDDGKPNLFADLGFARANCFNIPLIQHDVIRSPRQIEYALLSRGYPMEEAQKEAPFLARSRRWLLWRDIVRREILYQHRNVTNAAAKNVEKLQA